MYNVSNDYITAMRADTRVDDVTGTIVFPDGSSSVIDVSVIGVNSLKISRQCIDSDELMFGGCYLGTLDIELRTDKDRYAFFGAVIALDYRVVIGTDENDERIWETVPLGIYTVAEAERSADNNYIAVTAYDNVTLLDINWGDKAIYGTPWEILSEIATDTGIELAFTEQDLSAFPNYGAMIQVDENSGCGSYRDAVKVVVQLLGAFAQATRDGKLELRRFNTSSVQTLTKSHRYSIIVADYECHYISLFITGMRGTYHDETPNPDDFGLTMTIGDCPSFDYGADEVLVARTTNLFNYLEPIRYTPVDIDMPGDPAFDCADRLNIGVGTDTVQTIITSYEWRFRNGMTLKSEGINPYLVVSDQHGITSRIQNRIIDSNKLISYKFTNTSDITIADEHSAEIAKCIVLPMQDTNVIFMATILVHAEADSTTAPVTAKTSGGVVTPIYDGQGNPLTLTSTIDGQVSAKIWYTLDNEDMDYLAIDDLSSGDHIITVVYPFSVIAPQQHEWAVYMRAEGGSLSLVRSSMQGIIFGQNLLEGEEFDGLIEVGDEYSFTLGGHFTFDYSDSVDVNDDVQHEPWSPLELSENFTFTLGGNFEFNYADSVSITMEYLFNPWGTDEDDTITTDTGDVLYFKGHYTE